MGRKRRWGGEGDGESDSVVKEVARRTTGMVVPSSVCYFSMYRVRTAWMVGYMPSSASLSAVVAR